MAQMTQREIYNRWLAVQGRYPCLSLDGKHNPLRQSGRLGTRCQICRFSISKSRSPRVIQKRTRRQNVILVHGMYCKYCGLRLSLKSPSTSKRKFTLDHVIPLAAGGSNDWTNLVPCCSKCNSSKGDKLLSQWADNPSPYQDHRQIQLEVWIKLLELEGNKNNDRRVAS